MDRNKAKKLLPIIQAYAEGKSIEFSSITDVSKAWREVTDFPLGMIDSFKFRIKPESKYRPFANAEECWAEMRKHEPFGWIKHKKDGDRSLITNIDKFYNISLDGDDNWSFDKVMKFYTFADGVPFGVKVVEE